MQIQQLRYLIAASECGSFRAAAQKLYVAQSSISVAVKDLEREVGAALFERKANGIVLTREGADFLEHARTVVDQIDLMERRFSKSQPKQARLAVSSQHYSLVVDAFADFMEGRVGSPCTFALREPYTLELIRDVEQGRSDMGFLHLSAYNDRVVGRALEEANLIFTSLFTATPHVVVRGGHPLAGRERVTVDELSGYYRLVQERGFEESAYYAEEPFSSMAHDFEIVVSDNGTMTTLLLNSDGFVIGTGAFRAEGDLVAVPLETGEVMNVGMVERKNSSRSAGADEFFSCLCRCIVAFEGDIDPSPAVLDRLQAERVNEVSAPAEG